MQLLARFRLSDRVRGASGFFFELGGPTRGKSRGVPFAGESNKGSVVQGRVVAGWAGKETKNTQTCVCVVSCVCSSLIVWFVGLVLRGWMEVSLGVVRLLRARASGLYRDDGMNRHRP